MVFLVNLARVLFSPLLEPLKATFGATDATVGLLATLVWIGSASPRLPVGYLLTRVPRHYVVLAAGTVLTAAGGLSAVASSIEWLMVGAFCLGVSSGTYFIAANPLVTELFPDRVGDMIGIHGMSSQVAAVVAAPFVGGVILFGSWRLAFSLLAVVGGLTTVVLLVIISMTDLPAAGAADRHFVRAARRQWRLILVGVVFVGVTGFVWQGVFNFYVTYLITAKSLSQPAAQGLLTVLFGAGIPAFLITGYLAQRLPNAPLMFAVCGAFVCCLLVLTVVSGYLALFVVSAVLGYVIHCLFPTIDTLLLSSLPDESRASAYAVYSGGMMLVQAPGSSVLGALVDAGYGFDPVFRGFAGVVGLVLSVFVVVYLVGGFPTDRRTESFPVDR
ncbi:MFS transporter [Halocatena salina]|uniref:MFS transporter n=1 Tax=Halocatena salina TaxID=2934340 RepID=A0A8U0A054_9EURY|nr:MFS transporter [Halocatena salina]UPM42434.1 MFS transporter [Halocatena salina]